MLLAGLCAASVLAPALSRAATDGPKLVLPLACEIGRSCEVQRYVDRDPGPGALDWRCGHRTQDGHNGVDIRLLDMIQLARGLNVLAAADGRVARLRDGVVDISARDPAAPKVANQECGNGVVLDHGDGWETQYCHMARGSVRVKAGDMVKAGDPLGRVGLSGQTEYPHLHLTVRHAGKVIDPFDPAPADDGRCREGVSLAASMWTPAAQKALAYKPGVLLNAGFADAPVSLASIEAGGISAPNAGSAAMVAYVRAIGLQQGDVIEIGLAGPGDAGAKPLRAPPLDRDRQLYFAQRERARPAGGWPKGRYVAVFRLIRGGQAVAERRAEISL
jgi:hypothetical protein